MTAAHTALGHDHGLGRGARRVLRALVVGFAGLALGTAALTGIEAADTARVPQAPFADAGTAQLVARPDGRLAVGDLSVERRFAPVVRALGPADTTGADIDGTAHTWALDGVRLTVTESDGAIAAVAAEITGAAGRARLAHGVLLGRTTLEQLEARWGPPSRSSNAATDDFVATYDTCRGRTPYLVKFDQAAIGRDRPVTSVLLGRADGPAC